MQTILNWVDNRVEQPTKPEIGKEETGVYLCVVGNADRGNLVTYIAQIKYDFYCNQWKCNADDIILYWAGPVVFPVIDWQYECSCEACMSKDEDKEPDTDTDSETPADPDDSTTNGGETDNNGETDTENPATEDSNDANAESGADE